MLLKAVFWKKMVWQLLVFVLNGGNRFEHPRHEKTSDIKKTQRLLLYVH